jgi:hypothetical protein
MHAFMQQDDSLDKLLQFPKFLLAFISELRFLLLQTLVQYDKRLQFLQYPTQNKNTLT